MRIYFDSNIFRKIKPDSRLFHPELFKTVESLRKAFIFIFSDAHLSDLSKSDATYRQVDLKHMEEYVGNNFFSYDHIYKVFHIYLATPAEAYGNTDFHTFEKAIENPFQFIEDLFDQEDTKVFKPLMDIMLNAPLLTGLKLPPAYDQLNSPELTSALAKIHTLKDALEGASGVSGILTSGTEFAKMQSLMRNYINRDDYSFDKWSFDFDLQMKQTAFGKSFTEMVELICTGVSKDDTYNRFINFYSQLEFLGVTEERAGGKRKKNSMLEIQRDAAHAYFASRTKYFVSDDKGVLSKAFITYKMFDIKTEVLSVNDFITKSKFLMDNEEDLSSFHKGLKFSLKNGFVLHQSALTGDQVIKLSYPVLNYFDRLQVSVYNGKQAITLFQSAEDGQGNMWAEFDLLITKCTHLFGLPTAYKERLDIADYDIPEQSKARKWIFDQSEVVLDFAETTNGKSVIILQIIFQ